jgi:2-oxoisovalerate dehydrogenase E2 component (dihydrolipoyl transacylase)
MSVFTLPDLGEGLQEAEIVAWHVGEGDHVVADQPLVSVETEKAVVEVPSPHSGRIAHLRAAVGDRVKVGAPLVEFEDAIHPDTGTVVGELSATPTERPALAPRPALPPAPGAAVKATPAVRALAKQLGIDLAAVPPTGPGGTVTTHDVEAAASGAAAKTGLGEPLRGVRRAMAAAMVRSGAEIVASTVVDEADVDAWAIEADVTVRLAKAIAAASAAAPALNAWYDGKTMTRRVHDRVDLGVAVDTSDGLFVPVLRDVGGRDGATLRRELDALLAEVETRRIALDSMRGATFTLSNFGTLAGRFAALAIVPPQVAILGAGRIRARPAVVDGHIVARRLLPLSLTFDHRAVTGGEASRFLAAVIGDLERQG